MFNYGDNNSKRLKQVHNNELIMINYLYEYSLIDHDYPYYITSGGLFYIYIKFLVLNN